MKKSLFYITCLIISILIFSINLLAQFPEDALRYSYPGIGVGARSLAMGTAYTGIANDFSAVYWNPAGLGQIQLNELSLGLSHISYDNTSTFFSNKKNFSNSSTSLNSFGLVYPFPVARGSLVFAIGYNRQTDFTTGLSFKGFNPNSSIIQYWAPDGTPTERRPSGNIAYELYLANVDSISQNQYKWHSKIINRITQSGKVLEGGGLNNISLSGAIEAAKNLFFGATLNIITGSYSYVRNYYEDDFDNNYDYTLWDVISHGKDTVWYDFKSLILDETIEADLSGFSAKFGLLYKPSLQSRFGLSIKTPSFITVRETFSDKASSEFDNGDYFESVGAEQINEYDVMSPFIFSLGGSISVRDLLLSGNMEYADWTQMEFRDADSRLLGFNTEIKEIFRPTVNLKVGAEFEIPETYLRLRGGFAYLPSPYRGDPTTYDKKFITGGLGMIIENSFAIDLGYAYGFWETYRVNYDRSSKVNEKIKTHNLIATVTYRF